jgi:hypothetical protein
MISSSLIRPVLSEEPSAALEEASADAAELSAVLLDEASPEQAVNDVARQLAASNAANTLLFFIMFHPFSSFKIGFSLSETALLLILHGGFSARLPRL